MADIKGLLADHQFNQLDPATQKQVLGRIDSSFSGLSDQDYSTFKQRMTTPSTTAGSGSTGLRLKGTPAELPNTFMGTLTGDLAGVPGAAFHALAHPLEALSGIASGLVHLPQDLYTDVSQGNFGKLGARAAELGMLGAPSIPEDAASTTLKATRGAIKGGAQSFIDGKSSIPAAAGATIGHFIHGPQGAEIGAGLGALPGTLQGMYRGAQSELNPITPKPNYPVPSMSWPESPSAPQPIAAPPVSWPQPILPPKTVPAPGMSWPQPEPMQAPTVVKAPSLSWPKPESAPAQKPIAPPPLAAPTRVADPEPSLIQLPGPSGFSGTPKPFMQEGSAASGVSDAAATKYSNISNYLKQKFGDKALSEFDKSTSAQRDQWAREGHPKSIKSQDPFNDAHITDVRNSLK